MALFEDQVSKQGHCDYQNRLKSIDKITKYFRALKLLLLLTFQTILLFYLKIHLKKIWLKKSKNSVTFPWNLIEYKQIQINRLIDFFSLNWFLISSIFILSSSVTLFACSSLVDNSDKTINCSFRYFKICLRNFRLK